MYVVLVLSEQQNDLVIEFTVDASQSGQEKGGSCKPEDICHYLF